VQSSGIFTGVTLGVIDGIYSRNQTASFCERREHQLNCAQSYTFSTYGSQSVKSSSGTQFQRQHQPAPKLGEFQAQLPDWLVLDAKLPKCQCRMAQRLFECLQVVGYQGSYGPVQRFVLNWK